MPTKATKDEAKVPESYKDALEELEKIMADVEDRDVDIDVLSEKVKRAHQLIEYCQSRIDAVRFEVDNIVEREGDQ
jgi:exodeoxyribonuclease VII small subunit